MFITAEQVIDQIQSAKKTFVNTVVFDKAAREASIDFIDAQTHVAKVNAKFVQETADTVTSESKKMFDQLVKFDYSKFFKQSSNSAE